MIAQEVRTPLASTLMMLEGLLYADQINEGARAMVLIIISQINLLLSLVNDMLDIELI